MSIAIVPSSPSVASGLTEQLHATGIYSDGSTSDLTSSVIINWTSAATAVATIDSTGLASGIAVGTSVISAYSGSVLGTATLTVTAAVVKSIAISPNPVFSGVGITLQLTAVGTYSDGSTAAVPNGVAWTSSAPSVATVGATTGATIGQSVGATTISASIGSVVASAPLSIVANAWGTTGSMATGREGATATLLTTGKVLEAGGYAGQGQGTEELFDSATGAWSQTAALLTAVSHHTATLLKNGLVLVAGGWYEGTAGTATTAAELYNPETGTWSATGSLLTARALHTATLLPDGTVLVSGGQGSNFYDPELFLGSAEIYDPVAGTWKATGVLKSSRSSHTATLLPNGKVLVAGGFGEPPQSATGETLASAEIYDPATLTWTATGSLTTAVVYHTATLLASGQVLVVGGSPDDTISSPAVTAAQLYNPATGTWTPTGGLLTGVLNHTATLLSDGKVLVAGGQVSGTTGPPIATAEMYDPMTSVWSAAGSLASARTAHTATLLPNDTVLAAGGDSDSAPSTSSELYFPRAGP